MTQTKEIGRYEPRPGDLVEFPVTGTDGVTKWVHASFEPTKHEGKMIVRAGATPYLVDENFQQMFNVRYVGATSEGKRKFTVFHRPSPEQAKSLIEVRLDVGTETVVTQHKALSKAQALTYAVVSWCKKNQLPQHQHGAFIARFQTGEPGYNYSTKLL